MCAFASISTDLHRDVQIVKIVDVILVVASRKV